MFSYTAAPCMFVNPTSKTINLKSSFGLHGSTLGRVAYKQMLEKGVREFLDQPSDSESSDVESALIGSAHREKVPNQNNPKLPFTGYVNVKDVVDHVGLVHLQLTPQEWRKIPKAKAAAQKEYDQLLAINFVDLQGFQEYREVLGRASRTGKTIYVCRIFLYAILNIVTLLNVIMYTKEELYLVEIWSKMKMV